jgi:hypothetical protein
VLTALRSRLPLVRPIHLAGLLLLAALAAVLVAQIEGERGIAPIASSGDFEVRDVRVDISAPTADAARTAGWRLAQRLAWRQLWARTNGGAAPTLPDGQLDAMVSGIEVQSEQIGPNRYIATLAVLFDRARAGQLLGVSGPVIRSAPLLLIPVLTEGGVTMTFERVNEWQRAWASFRTGDSAIDYVRTSGSGGDSLLLNAGQIGRRSRLWWRALLDQYGAADVVMPHARIERLWPGGPVVGHFSARFGPDNRYLGDFTLRVDRPEAVPGMMAEAAKRIDTLYTQALTSGALTPDPSLIVEEPVDPDLLNAADAAGEEDSMPVETTGVLGTQVTIQYDTPNVASVGQGEAVLRAIPGVRSAATTSLALGGTSVMQVTADLGVDDLRTALLARGYAVARAGNTLRISRRETP